MDRDSGVLIRIAPALGGESNGLVRRIASDYVGILDHDGGVSEDEIDGAVNVALLVKLALRVDVESVLKAFESAAVEDGEIGAGPERHRLVVLRSGGVSEGNVTGDESVSIDS